MELMLRLVKKLARFMFWISCSAIITIVFLTTFDVISRRLGNPIDFTYEVVTYLGAIVIGFSIPQATLDKTHVVMDFLTEKLPKRGKTIFSCITRCLAIITFIIIGWNIIKMGNYLHKTGQATDILKIPDYPAAYGIGLCCFIVCLILFFDLLNELREIRQ